MVREEESKKNLVVKEATENLLRNSKSRLLTSSKKKRDLEVH